MMEKAVDILAGAATDSQDLWLYSQSIQKTRSFIKVVSLMVQFLRDKSSLSEADGK